MSTKPNKPKKSGDDKKPKEEKKEEEIEEEREEDTSVPLLPDDYAGGWGLADTMRKGG